MSKQETTAEPAPAQVSPGTPCADDLEALLELDPVPTWEEVASKYGQKIYTMAYRLTGDPDEAKDLTQDVFVRVYRNLHKYRPGTFDGWLYRITKNLFLDKVRRKRRIRMEPLPDQDWNQPVETGPSPEQRLEDGMLRGDIERALATLPPNFRAAVVLCDIQDLTYQEIAAATGWPLGTVRSRIHRGRRLLRAALVHEHWDAGKALSADDQIPDVRPESDA
ncbi:MAG: RNA polymerase sigma-70 factor (ECF subfamily) [Glaciecola sp.]